MLFNLEPFLKTTKKIFRASLITRPYKPMCSKLKINKEANFKKTPIVVVFKV